MSSEAPNPYEHLTYSRDGRRYETSGRCELVRDGQVHAVGELINISRSGAAFRTYTPLMIGAEYTFINPIFGPVKAMVARRFDTHSFAVQFRINHQQREFLERLIRRKFA